MTNAEKFENVFGYKPNKSLCYAPGDVECPPDCDDCPYISWLNEEYVEPKQGEQEPCEDWNAVLDELNRIGRNAFKDDTDYDNLFNFISGLPNVKQEPKTGHWKLVQRGKSIDVCCSNCKAVRIKGYAYGYTIDQLDKEYVKESFESDDMRYCPYCGSYNRGRTIVKES